MFELVVMPWQGYLSECSCQVETRSSLGCMGSQLDAKGTTGIVNTTVQQTQFSESACWPLRLSGKNENLVRTL
jgi:hypothetical protein